MTSQSEQVQQLLASLASYSSLQNQGEKIKPQQSSTPDKPAVFTSNLPGLGFLAPEDYQSVLSKPSTPSPASYQTSLTPRPPENGTPDPRSRLQSSPNPVARTATPINPPAKAPVPDASLITDWTTAIRHVMQHLLPQPDFGARIRRLITTQHQYEEDWFSKRELITARHASRETSSAQLNNIFANLGVPTPATPAKAGRDLEAETRELAEYDAKVYKQLLALVGDFDRQLRQLGVPFYAIKHELVILEEGREKEAFSGKGRLDRGELRELQRRMLEWLEMSFPPE